MFHDQQRRLPAIITLIAGMVVGCSNETPNEDRVPGRWYTADQVTQGSAPFGGVMPGFAEMLSEDEARAIVAYFQSFWPDDIYARWQEIDSR